MIIKDYGELIVKNIPGRGLEIRLENFDIEMEGAPHPYSSKADMVKFVQSVLLQTMVRYQKENPLD